MGSWATERRTAEPSLATASAADESTAPRISGFEQILLFLALAVFFSIGPENPTPQLGKSNLQSTLGQGAALAITVPLLLLQWRATVPLILRSPLLVAFIALAFASVSWSAFPALTFRRDASLLAPILVGMTVALRYPPQDVLRLVGRFCLAMTGISLLVVIAFPAVGVMHDPYNPELNGAWRGFTPHKSVFGTILLLGFEIYAWRAFFEAKRRWPHAGIALAMLVICFLARSSTALIAMCLTVPLLALLASRRSGARLRWLPELVFWSLLVFGLLLLPFLLTSVIQLLGKDLSLTGRVPLWQSLIPYIADRPWTGYGYGAFWVDGTPWVIRVKQLNPWDPPDAHNGYMGVALELGIPGAVIATAFLLSVIARAYRTGRSTGPSWAVCFFVFAFLYAVVSLVETPLLSMGSVFTFMLSFCHFGLVRHAVEATPRDVADLNRAGKPAADASTQSGLRFRRIGERPSSRWHDD